MTSRLSALVLAAVMVVLATPFGAISQPAQTSPEALFQSRCATCHSLTRAVRPLRALPEVERRKRLEALLANHHAPDPKERALMVDYLVAAAATR